MRAVRIGWRTATLVSFLLVAQADVIASSAQGGTRYSNQARREAACSGSWEVVRSPNSSEFDDQSLLAVSASGRNDAWAVGFLGSGGAGFIGTLTLHWNGASWRVVESPNPTSFFNALYGVVAIAPDDAWAVGSFARSPAHFRERPLSMHWDGHSWTVVPVARRGKTVASLSGVDATRSGRVWAVGYSAHESSGDNRTLVESWTGTRWEIVESPTSRSGITRLVGVDAINSPKAWAVGVLGHINEGKALAERWNGREWTTVPVRSVGTRVSELDATSARTPADVWAVGSFQTGAESFQPLAEHFDGKGWSVVLTPRVRGTAGLSGVAARSREDAWAVGAHEVPPGTRPLVEHWNGVGWTVVPVPRPAGSLAAGLTAIGTNRAHNLWAVGSYQEPVRGVYRTLIERLCRG